MQIRPGLSTDHTAIIGAYRDVFSDPPWNEHWTEAAAKAVIEETNRSWYTAYEVTLSDICLGFAATMIDTPDTLSRYLGANLGSLPDGQYGYLADIGVRREFRRRGLAERLWRQAEQGLYDQAVTGIMLRVHREAVTYSWFLSQAYYVIYSYTDGTNRVILARMSDSVR